MSEALENHTGTVSIGGRHITNLRFADDIDGIAGKEAKLANLVRQMERASSRYGMEISAEKKEKTDGKQQQHHHSKHLSSRPET